MKFEHFPATWATFASQMGVFIAVGGVQRLIGISVPMLCIGTVYLHRDEVCSSSLLLPFTLSVGLLAS